jgi:hypothetical protein
MRTEPTLYLRFTERDEIVMHPNATCTVTRPVRVLQQFWAHPDGKEAAGDMFRTVRGEWRDVPLVPRA